MHYKNRLKTVTNRNKGSINRLNISRLQSANRNKKCYGNRNKKCYDLGSLSNCIPISYRVLCYDLLRSNRLQLTDNQRLTTKRNKKTVTKTLYKIRSEKPRKHRILLRGRAKGDIYEPTLEKDNYKNLSTGQVGRIDKDIVAKHLVVGVRENQMQMKNKYFAVLVERLGLAMSN